MQKINESVLAAWQPGGIGAALAWHWRGIGAALARQPCLCTVAQTMLDGNDGCLRAVCHVQFGKNGAQVVAHGAL